jgi:uncharacterized RDD family membrane protein YckC
MMEEMGKNLISLAISLLIAFVAVRHFQGRRYPRSQKYLTFWPRFWSPTIDSIVLWPFTVLIPFLVQAAILKTQTASRGMICFTSVIHFAYVIHFNARYGGTIGKLKCNLRIVDHKSEGPISYRQAIMRDAIPMVLVLVLCAYSARIPAKSAEVSHAFHISLVFLAWFLAEILTMLTNSKRRALHDYIAGTVVVRTNVG